MAADSMRVRGGDRIFNNQAEPLNKGGTPSLRKKT